MNLNMSVIRAVTDVQIIWIILDMTQIVFLDQSISHKSSLEYLEKWRRKVT